LEFTLANTAQAKKRARQAEQHRMRNAGLRSALRTSIKKVIAAIEGKNHKEAEVAYKAAVPMIDRMATKGIIHKNKAARHKSRLTAHIKALAA
jgi:small subunit ribosomal protein S20